MSGSGGSLGRAGRDRRVRRGGRHVPGPAGGLRRGRSYENIDLFDLEGVPLVSYRPGLDSARACCRAAPGDRAGRRIPAGPAAAQPVTDQLPGLPGPQGALGVRRRAGLPGGWSIGVVALELDDEGSSARSTATAGWARPATRPRRSPRGTGWSTWRRRGSTPPRRSATDVRFGDARGRDMQRRSGATGATARCPTTRASRSSRPGPTCRRTAGGSRSSRTSPRRSSCSASSGWPSAC